MISKKLELILSNLSNEEIEELSKELARRKSREWYKNNSERKKAYLKEYNKRLKGNI